MKNYVLPVLLGAAVLGGMVGFFSSSPIALFEEPDFSEAEAGRYELNLGPQNETVGAFPFHLSAHELTSPPVEKAWFEPASDGPILETSGWREGGSGNTIDLRRKPSVRMVKTLDGETGYTVQSSRGPSLQIAKTFKGGAAYMIGFMRESEIDAKYAESLIRKNLFELRAIDYSDGLDVTQVFVQPTAQKGGTNSQCASLVFAVESPSNPPKQGDVVKWTNALLKQATHAAVEGNCKAKRSPYAKRVTGKEFVTQGETAFATVHGLVFLDEDILCSQFRKRKEGRFLITPRTNIFAKHSTNRAPANSTQALVMDDAQRLMALNFSEALETDSQAPPQVSTYQSFLPSSYDLTFETYIAKVGYNAGANNVFCIAARVTQGDAVWEDVVLIPREGRDLPWEKYGNKGNGWEPQAHAGQLGTDLGDEFASSFSVDIDY